MTGQDTRPGSFHHLGILDRLVDVPKDSKLGRDGDREVFMEGVDYQCGERSVSFKVVWNDKSGQGNER